MNESIYHFCDIMTHRLITCVFYDINNKQYRMIQIIVKEDDIIGWTVQENYYAITSIGLDPLLTFHKRYDLSILLKREFYTDYRVLSVYNGDDSNIDIVYNNIIETNPEWAI